MYYKSAAAAAVLLVLVGAVAGKDCHSKKSSSKLFCYYGKAKDIDSCKCSHIILPADADVKSIEGLRDKLGATKILLTVNEFNEGLVNTLKTTKVDGLEINLKKLDSKNDISDFISTVRSKLGSDLYLALSVPPKTETLAKYYDFKSLTKHADVFILQTHLLGLSKNVTFHPSRLSGLWDVQNTDSVVDLVSGLGAPLSKLVITAPVQGFKFTLQNEKHTAPGSPALELSTLTRDQLCEKMGSDKWMLERDQDQAGPYIFRKNEWVSFEDSMSMDIKAKYSRVRGLAGLALKDLSQDGGVKCGETLLESAYSGLSKQARAPRGAVLHSLEREILQTPSKILDNVQVSPYRISRVIDVEGKVHVMRQDTRTEFACSRQGYFVHPRSCGRFYRCVKFDQLSDEFSVFEFDCPAGLAFDERVEVCVWPGSLPHASACSGSSEIAPVPRERFICPGEQGYYADPENCRWFFACLDHGKSPLSAYEFRCPYGLVFDEERLMCEWSWLVPKCGSGYASGHGDDYYYGGLHNSKGVAVGLDLYDGLGSLNGIKLGGLSGPLVQPIQKTYSTLGSGHDIVANVFGVQPQISLASGHSNGFGGSGIYIAGSGNQYGQNHADNHGEHSFGYHAGADSARYLSSSDGSGSYRHDGSGSYNIGSSGDRSLGYHAGADSARYYSSSDNSGSYNAENSGSYAGDNAHKSVVNIDHTGNYNAGESGSFVLDNSGSYKHDDSGNYKGNSGSYVAISTENSGSYKDGDSGSYNGNSGSHVAISTDNSGSYRHDDSGSYNGNSGSYVAVTADNSGSYKHDISGSFNGNSGSHVAISTDNSGGYKHDDSGSFNGNSGSHIAISTDNSGSYKHDDSGSFNRNSGSHVAISTDNSGGYKHDDSGSFNGNSGSHIAISTDNSGSYKHDDSGNFNGNSGSYVAISNDNSGSYKHDSGSHVDVSRGNSVSGTGHAVSNINIDHSGNSNAGGYGSYNAANSGAYVINQNFGSLNSGASDNTGSYKHDDSGSFNGNSGSYVAVTADNSGSYKHDDSGRYNGNSGTYVADNSGTYKHGALGSYQGAGTLVGISGSGHSGANVAGTGSFSIDHTGGYNAGGSNSYVSDNSGSYKHGLVFGEKENSGLYVGHSSGYASGAGSYVSDNSGGYKHDTTGSYNAGNSGAYVGVGVLEHSGNVAATGSYNAGHVSGAYITGSGISAQAEKTYSSGHAVSHSYHHSGSSDESGSYKEDHSGEYIEDNSGSYIADNSGSYKGENSGSYSVGNAQSTDNSGSYHGNSGSSGKYQSGQSGSSYASFTSGSGSQSHSASRGSVNYQSSKSNSGGGSYSYSHSDQSNYKHEQLGQVNIIAGGASGVGVAKGVELIQHGINLGGVEHVTPLTIVSSSIPSVTSVPLPTKSGFEFFNGGVVANIPDLQLKLEHPTTINAYLGNFGTYKEAKAKDLGFANYTHFVSSTQAPFVIKSDVISSGFDVAKVKSEQAIGDNGGYIYPKPSIAFEEKRTYLPPAPSTYLPPAPSTYLPPIQSTYLPAVSTTPATYLPPVSPTVYLLPSTTPKPTAAVYLPPAPSTYLPPKSYSYGRRTSHKSSYVIPSKPIQGHKFGVVESQSYHNRQRVYQYVKPTITFEEKHKTIVQPAVAYQEIKHDVQPVTIHKQVQQHGYHYEKPTIAFEEKPVVVEHKTILQPTVAVQPAVTYQEIKHDIQPVTIHKQVQPTVTFHQSEGYHYEKPNIAFEEKPVVVEHKTIVQPAVTYQEIKHDIQPVTIHKQVQPTVTFHQTEGYHYEKPKVAFEEKPVVVQHKAIVQPAVTYQEIKHDVQPVTIHKQVQPTVTFHQTEGYHYEKPNVAFEEKPVVIQHKTIVQPAVTYQEIKHDIQPVTIHKQVQPTVTFHQTEGYHYEKPKVAFEEKPVVVQHETIVQPALTYQEIKHNIQPTTIHKQVHPAVTFHQTEGYHYEKPKVAFEEKQVVQHKTIVQPAVTYQEIKHNVQPVTIHKQVQPTFTFHQTESYHYEKPAIAVQPAVAYQEIKHVQPAVQEVKVEHSEGYHYEKPAFAFQEVKVAKLAFGHKTEVKHEQPEGYHYEKPSVAFEEKVVVQQPVQTVVKHYEKPTVTYQEVKHENHVVNPIQPTIVEHTPVAYQEVKVENQGYKYEKPQVHTYVHHQQAQHKEHHSVAHQEVKHEGYHYEKPVVAFEEKPIVHVQPKVTYQEYKPAVTVHEVKPAVTYQEYKPAVTVTQPVVTYQQEVKPAVTYQHVNLKPTVIQHHYENSAANYEHKVNVEHKQVQVEGYHYEKPSVAFEEVNQKTAVQPAVTFQEISQPVVYEQKPTYKEVVTKVSKPAIISSFSITQPAHEKTYLPPVQPTRTYLPVEPVKTYIPSQPKEIYLPAPKPTLEYLPAPKPTLVVKETYLPVPKPTLEYLPAPKPTLTYLPAPKPTVTYLPAPKPSPTYIPVVKQDTIVESYFHNNHDVKPAVAIDYSEEEEVSEEPIVAKKTFLTYQKESGYEYPKPEVKFEEEPLINHNFYSYDSRFGQKEGKQVVDAVATVEENIPVVKTSRPIVRYEFSSLDDKYNNYENYEIQKETYVPVTTRRPVVVTTPRREYLPVTTPKQTYLPVTTPQQTYLPVKTLKRVYLPVTTTERYVEVTNPSVEYLPVTQEIYRIRTRVTTAKPSREYLPVTTARPSKEYLPVITARPTPVTTAKPSREYLPVTTRTRTRTRTRKPSREYLPVTSEQPSLEYLPVTRRPKTKITKSKTIVKVNDFHPILSAKLGAQCTCVSNTLTLRKKTKNLNVERENYPIGYEIRGDNKYSSGKEVERENYPAGYVVDHDNAQNQNEDDDDEDNDTTVIKDAVDVVVEDFKFEPEKIIRPTEAVYIEEPSSEAIDIFVNKGRKQSVRVIKKKKPSKEEIADAVDTGLKLVKSAVKEGVKEGVKEALETKDFDRYGPGGVRGRSETLQGTIDCQRAGLFRHPKHCNKFYACRWDCDKKKFTLHVFNCPVHLTFDNNLGACNWPSQGPACVDDTLLPSV